jgi:hypothetical protein
MAITTLDELINGLANNSSRIVIDKASIANAAANQFHSLWRATGQPGQGAIPTTAAVCNDTLLGGMRVTQQTAPNTSYLAYLEIACGNNTVTMEVHDRLAHMGGLVGNVTTLQTVTGMDLSTLLATDNLDARKGDANYSDVQWWLEWYTDTGATVSNATVSVVYDNGTTGNLTAISLAATRRASFMQPLNGLTPAAQSGRFIRGVTGVQLSASTAAAGNFGVTATRVRSSAFLPIASQKAQFDWANLGLPEVANDSCLFLVQIASTTSTGVVRGSGKVAHG